MNGPENFRCNRWFVPRIAWFATRWYDRKTPGNGLFVVDDCLKGWGLHWDFLTRNSISRYKRILYRESPDSRPGRYNKKTHRKKLSPVDNCLKDWGLHWVFQARNSISRDKRILYRESPDSRTGGMTGEPFEMNCLSLMIAWKPGACVGIFKREIAFRGTNENCTANRLIREPVVWQENSWEWSVCGWWLPESLGLALGFSNAK